MNSFNATSGRRLLCAAAAAMVVSAIALAGAAAPLNAQGSSAIFLLRVKQTDGRVVVQSVAPVETPDGYNNQPAFPRNGTLLFTHAAPPGPESQADIWIDDERSVHPFTKTKPESEYSAYHMPGKDRISVIRVEADSTQRLWSFDLRGMDPQLVLTKLRPIGYQAWVDENHVAVFVLGDAATRAPATLQLVDIRDESAIPIAEGIGRALQPVPGRKAVSFTRRDSANTRWIDVYDVASKTITHAVKSLPENEYHVWLPNGVIVSARGSQLFQFTPGKDADWVMIADLAEKGVKGISRIAVSADGTAIALVAAR